MRKERSTTYLMQGILSTSGISDEASALQAMASQAPTSSAAFFWFNFSAFINSFVTYAAYACILLIIADFIIGGLFSSVSFLSSSKISNTVENFGIKPANGIMEYLKENTMRAVFAFLFALLAVSGMIWALFSLVALGFQSLAQNAMNLSSVSLNTAQAVKNYRQLASSYSKEQASQEYLKQLGLQRNLVNQIMQYRQANNSDENDPQLKRLKANYTAAFAKADILSQNLEGYAQQTGQDPTTYQEHKSMTASSLNQSAAYNENDLDQAILNTWTSNNSSNIASN